MTDVLARTDLGAVRGTESDGLATFRGVPYAAAPEGPLRLRPPAPAEAWDGVRDATRFGAAPPQPPAAPGTPPIWRPEDGMDCLNVNVWTPDLGGGGLPVMVWFYGGAWRIGASPMPHYDAARLARAGVVVVTFDYRTGFEGFGHLPGVPDNRGLRDQIAALEWVRRNIAAFGGDPDRVTAFGQSAGAASIVLLAGAPEARGLFRRAIAHSVPDGYHDVAEASGITGTVAAAAGVEPTWEGFAALPPEALVAAQDAPVDPVTRPVTAYAPVIDGDLVTGPPWARIADAADVELVCGFVHEEARAFLPSPVPPELTPETAGAATRVGVSGAERYRAAYPQLGDVDLSVALLSDAMFRMPTLRTAEAHAAAGGRTWVFDFAWRNPAGINRHSIDVPFVFGLPDSRFALRHLGSPTPDGFPALSDAIRGAWTSFAAEGDPGWRRYDASTGRITRVWDDRISDVPLPIAPSLPIWTDLA
ncbi:carboxylesterase/lipase family protein [Actinomadura logoneensis]|uniref:Carboxylesterase/lipase family protein n=1 Tax=Actinomadura logoneensis TaxID=2293572 RepID=A0A372JJF2_9ACTN|nr:carboxylesterase family protein [Actinomadura logoneensis]RFU40151.1 carboxylesterase/lipase family protein [Actinomadura logoneensis]